MPVNALQGLKTAWQAPRIAPKFRDWSELLNKLEQPCWHVELLTAHAMRVKCNTLELKTIRVEKCSVAYWSGVDMCILDFTAIRQL